MNGIEIMLKSMGLGEIIQEAKDLAQSGALQKILLFSEKLDAHNKLLADVEKAFNGLCSKCGADFVPGSGPIPSPDAATGGNGSLVALPAPELDRAD